MIDSASFADTQLIDALKGLAHDPSTDSKVRKKLMSVLASWHLQFKDQPSMSTVAGLYRQSKPSEIARNRLYNDPVLQSAGLDPHGEIERRRREEKEKERQKREKEKEEKRAAKEAKEKARADAKRKGQGVKRKPFNFEQVCY